MQPLSSQRAPDETATRFGLCYSTTALDATSRFAALASGYAIRLALR